MLPPHPGAERDYLSRGRNLHQPVHLNKLS
jgi:hypothetical protein